jgi:hypothetical protein
MFMHRQHRAWSSASAAYSARRARQDLATGGQGVGSYRRGAPRPDGDLHASHPSQVDGRHPAPPVVGWLWQDGGRRAADGRRCRYGGSSRSRSPNGPRTSSTRASPPGRRTARPWRAGQARRGVRRDDPRLLLPAATAARAPVGDRRRPGRAAADRVVVSGRARAAPQGPHRQGVHLDQGVLENLEVAENELIPLPELDDPFTAMAQKFCQLLEEFRLVVSEGTNTAAHSRPLALWMVVRSTVSTSTSGSPSKSS